MTLEQRYRVAAEKLHAADLEIANIKREAKSGKCRHGLTYYTHESVQDSNGRHKWIDRVVCVLCGKVTAEY